MTTQREAAEFVRAIRSPGKKAFAIAYLNYKIGKADKPDLGRFNVGYMGAQSVWLRLDAIFERAQRGDPEPPAQAWL